MSLSYNGVFTDCNISNNFIIQNSSSNGGNSTLLSLSTTGQTKSLPCTIEISDNKMNSLAGARFCQINNFTSAGNQYSSIQLKIFNNVLNINQYIIWVNNTTLTNIPNLDGKNCIFDFENNISKLSAIFRTTGGTTNPIEGCKYIIKNNTFEKCSFFSTTLTNTTDISYNLICEGNTNFNVNSGFYQGGTGKLNPITNDFSAFSVNLKGKINQIKIYPENSTTNSIYDNTIKGYTISASNPKENRLYIIPDVLKNSTFLFEDSQTIIDMKNAIAQGGGTIDTSNFICGNITVNNDANIIGKLTVSQDQYFNGLLTCGNMNIQGYSEFINPANFKLGLSVVNGITTDSISTNSLIVNSTISKLDISTAIINKCNISTANISNIDSGPNPIMSKSGFQFLFSNGLSLVRSCYIQCPTALNNCLSNGYYYRYNFNDKSLNTSFQYCNNTTTTNITLTSNNNNALGLLPASGSIELGCFISSCQVLIAQPLNPINYSYTQAQNVLIFDGGKAGSRYIQFSCPSCLPNSLIIFTSSVLSQDLMSP